MNEVDINVDRLNVVEMVWVDGGSGQQYDSGSSGLKVMCGQLGPMKWWYLLWCVASHLVTDIPVSIVVPDCFMEQGSCLYESAIKKSRWLWRLTASPDEAPDVVVG